MDFRYGTTFGDQSPEAYERLLLDVMAGDATLFMRDDAVEASWQWIQPILDVWAASGERWLPEYPAGSWGPVEADCLIDADGYAWRQLWVCVPNHEPHRRRLHQRRLCRPAARRACDDSVVEE